MQGLISAIRFMTILLLGNRDVFDPRRMVPCFPVVGIILGVMLSAVDRAVSCMWPEPAAAVLDVVFLVAVTGAFHLDGLGDTADGLLGHRSREKALAVMKDIRIGVMGR